jgi:tetratricopeptide (TPR) repeat protein
LVDLGETDEAKQLAAEGTEYLKDVASTDAGRGEALIGDIYEALGDREEARRFYESAAERLRPMGDRYLVEVYGKLAALHEAEGRPDEALAVLKKAMAVQAPGASVSTATG